MNKVKNIAVIKLDQQRRERKSQNVKSTNESCRVVTFYHFQKIKECLICCIFAELETESRTPEKQVKVNFNRI